MNRLLDSNILIYAAQPENSFLDTWISPVTAQVSAISIPEVLGFPGLTAEDEARIGFLCCSSMRAPARFSAGLRLCADNSG